MKICIYGASSNSIGKCFFDDAEKLGVIIGSNAHTLIFGGGNGGLMGACAKGAHSVGGEIIGIAPRFFDEPGVLYENCSEFIYTDTMRERKHLMEDMADAFVILPGGIGTYEEFFETLTLKQLGKHTKPMVMLNTDGYYDAMYSLLQNTVDNGFMSKSCMDIFSLAGTPDVVLDMIKAAPTSEGSIRRLSDYNK